MEKACITHRSAAFAKGDVRLLCLTRTTFDEIVLSQRTEEDEDEDEEDEEDGDTCLASQLVNIFVISDSTGESASASVKTAAAQFEYCSGSTCAASRATVYRFVRSAAEIKKIVQEAKKRNALLVTCLNLAGYGSAFFRLSMGRLESQCLSCCQVISKDFFQPRGFDP